MTHECEHCGKTFSCKSSLKTHIASAKYCIKSRENPTPTVIFKCESCGMACTTRQNLNRHQQICTKHLLNLQAEKFMTDGQLSIQTVSSANEALRRELARLRKVKERLLRQNQNLLYQLKQPKNIALSKLLPMTDEHIKSCAKYLTLEHVRNHVDGISAFAIEYVFKNRLVCTDYSRRVLKYKDCTGEIETDAKLAKLSTVFLDSIQDSFDSIFKKYVEECGNKHKAVREQFKNWIITRNNDKLQNQFVEKIARFFVTKPTKSKNQSDAKSEIPKYTRTSENEVNSYFFERDYVMLYNRKIGTYKVDISFKCNTHEVFLEIDENQHRHYKNEDIRMHNISELIDKPVVIIRFNPSKFTLGGKCCDDYPLEDRLEVVRRTVDEHLNCKPAEKLTVIRLFYDNKNNNIIEPYII